MSSQQTSKRKLAAILFADIEGYTSMMQQDEQAASSTLRHFQKQLEEKVALHNGTIVNSYGDGALCSFEIPVDAVHCALELQSIFSQDPKTPVRIGIHSGTVTLEDGKIFGNSVNLASRIESMGCAQSILVSKKVRDEVKNNPDLKMQSLGHFEFKNVDEPMEVFALANEGLQIPSSTQLKGKFKVKSSKIWSKQNMAIVGVVLLLIIAQAIYSQFNKSKTSFEGVQKSTIQSIAVLPLINLNPNFIDQEIFSDGVTQEIIDELAIIKDIAVSAFTATYIYKNQSKSNKEIADELEADLLMSGTSRIFSSGDSVRLSLELVDPNTQKRVWNGTFNETMDNAPKIQSSIAKQVARSLNIKLSPTEEEAINKPVTSSGEAFKLFLLAKAEINKFTTESFNSGREFLKKAIELDPDYTQAYTLMAWSYAVGSSPDITPGTWSSKEAIQKVEPFYEESLKLDPTNSNIYVVKGFVNLYLKNLIRDAKKDVDYAIELNSWPQVPINYCMCTVVSVYMALGDHKKATEVAALAKKIDPGNLLLHWDDGNLAMMEGDFEKAQKHYQFAADRAPLPVFTSWLGWSFYHGGNYEKALEILLTTYNENPLSIGMNIAYLSNTYLKLGDKGKSDFYFEELKKRSLEGEHHLNYSIATVYMARKDFEHALDHLEIALRNGAWGIAVNSSIDPIFQPIHEDPRFIEFRKKMQYYE